MPGFKAALTLAVSTLSGNLEVQQRRGHGDVLFFKREIVLILFLKMHVHTNTKM